MKNTKRITSSALCLVLLIAAGGCRREVNEVAATNAATPNTTTKNAASGPSKASKSVAKAPVNVIKKTPAKAPPKMTASQELGISILKALNTDPTLQHHGISVGTSDDTVTLNGKVRSAAQKQTAERIAHHQAKNFKIVNSLIIASP